jgi:hypothetical protein
LSTFYANCIVGDSKILAKIAKIGSSENNPV